MHVLAGLGGTGKSTIALALAEAAAARGIPAWWVPAVDAETVTARLLELAEDLGAAPGEAAQARAGQRNPADLLWRHLGRRTRWLLILDNVDDPAVLTVGDADAASGAGWLRPVYSSGAGQHLDGGPAPGLIVVTSRNGDARAWGRHAELHRVGWLDRADGGRVLTDLARHAGTAQEAEALSERLGGLPLALHHAGSQLASDFAAERTFAGYTRTLDAQFARLMGGRPGAAGAKDGRRAVLPAGDAADRAVITTTWEVSLDALAAGGRPQARRLLRVLCCLAPAVLIPVALLDLPVLSRVCDSDEERAADGLRALASVGLITNTRGADGELAGVTVHPLVSETSRLRLGTEGPAGVGGAAVALLAAAADSLDATKPGDWPTWVRLVPHLYAVYPGLAAELADEDLAALTRVTNRACRAFEWGGSYAADLELAQYALSCLDRLGADHEAPLGLRYRIASALYYLGRYEQAEHNFRQVLEAETRVLGPDHSSTLATRYEIARITADQGRYEQAERDYRELLETRARVAGPDHPATLAARHGIAYVIGKQGRHRQAEQDYRQVLEARIRVLGPDHPDTLGARHSVAAMLHAQGKTEEARREFRSVLEAKTRVLGADHPSTRVTASWIR